MALLTAGVRGPGGPVGCAICAALALGVAPVQAATPRPPLPPGGPVRIHDIQGAAHTSPLVGTRVVDVPGVVTAVGSNRFWIQDPRPDSDPATSEALVVFTRSAPTVAVGDAVTVAGTVAEFRPAAPSRT